MPAALRTPASLSAGTRPVAAIRSATSSASALIGGGGPPIPLPPGGVTAPGSVPGVRSWGGRSVSIYPSFEVSAGGAPALIPHRLNLTPPGADIALDEGLSALVGRPSLGTGSRPRGRPRLPRSRDGSGRPHLLRPQRRAPAFRGLGEHVLGPDAPVRAVAAGCLRSGSQPRGPRVLARADGRGPAALRAREGAGRRSHQAARRRPRRGRRSDAGGIRRRTSCGGNRAAAVGAGRPLRPRGSRAPGGSAYRRIRRPRALGGARRGRAPTGPAAEARLRRGARRDRRGGRDACAVRTRGELPNVRAPMARRNGDDPRSRRRARHALRLEVAAAAVCAGARGRRRDRDESSAQRACALARAARPGDRPPRSRSAVLWLVLPRARGPRARRRSVGAQGIADPISSSSVSLNRRSAAPGS